MTPSSTHRLKETEEHETIARTPSGRQQKNEHANHSTREAARPPASAWISSSMKVLSTNSTATQAGTLRPESLVRR